MLKLLWPLLKVILRIPALILRGTAHFVHNNTTMILPGDWLDWLRASCHAERRRPIFGANLEAWPARWRNVSYFLSFLQSDIVLGIEKPFSWIFNAISSEQSCPISMPFLLTYIKVRTVKFFPPAESWLVNILLLFDLWTFNYSVPRTFRVASRKRPVDHERLGPVDRGRAGTGRSWGALRMILTKILNKRNFKF